MTTFNPIETTHCINSRAKSLGRHCTNV